jgi:hypothetical protein
VKKWSPIEIETLERMAASGENSTDIAKALGRTPGMVQERCRRTGISLAYKQRVFTAAELEQFKLMARCGHSGTAIARTLNKTAEQVRKAAVRYGISLRRTQRTKDKIRTAIDEEAYALLDQEAAKRGESLSYFCRMLLQLTAYSGLSQAIIDQNPTRPPRPPKRPAYSAPTPALTPPPLPPPCVSIASLSPRLEGQIGYFASP